MFQEFARQENIKIKHGAPYTPTTTGGIERFNQTLVRKLKKLARYNEIEWDKVLQHAVECYRNCPSRATGHTPNEMRGIITSPKIDAENGITSNLRIIDKIKVAENIRVYQETYGREKGRNPASKYAVGDIVLLKNQKKMQDKMAPLWDRTARMTKILFGALEVEAEGRKTIVNTRNVKLFNNNKGIKGGGVL
jgi:hypothetical protein